MKAMKKHILPNSLALKRTVLAVLLLVFLTGIASLVIQPARASAATPGSPVFEDAAIAKCKKDFFGLEPWYAYITNEFFSATAPASSQKDPCSIKCFNIFDQGTNPDG